MSIIVVVGPDGAGKTSLIKKLHGTYKHFDKPMKGTTTAQYFNAMSDEIADVAPFSNVIFDRFFYCEMAYGPVMRGGSLLCNGDMVMLEQELMKQNAVIIFCNDNIFKLWKRCKERGEDYVPNLFTLWMIQRNYKKLLKQSRLPVLNYKICQNVPV